MQKKFLLTFYVFLMLTVMGCNTLQGLGEDFSAVGGWITRGADKVKETTQKETTDQ